MAETDDSVFSVLRADGPHEASAPQLMLYGRFVGAWDGTTVVHARDGSRREESCEVYFGWVLEGRAIQDVWIAPARKDRTDPARPTHRDIYGTTIRTYDPEQDVWYVTWIEPNTGAFSRMTGRQDGNDIVQEYRDDSGSRWQWCFTEITDDSIHWLARESRDDGGTWDVRNEFFLRRRAGHF
jgi:hypothetical protein